MKDAQLPLLGWDPPAFDPRFARATRTDVGRGGFIDHVPGWMEGHAALFEELRERVPWRTEQRVMYERVVETPRLLGDDPRHPLLDRAADALSRRYAVRFDAITLAYYRDGADSVAWHADRELRDAPIAFVAVVSLGAPRRFLVRPRGGGVSRAFTVGWGDVLVMGGTCQREHEHAGSGVAARPT